jgi:hypothetical protein
VNSYLQMAIERHKWLIEDARRQRERCLLHKMALERPLRRRKALRGLRNRVGDLLVYCGQRLKTDASYGAWG